jgi:hypothetical protein
LVGFWRRQVGFHATGLQNETVDEGKPLIFHDVAYNSGHAYNAFSGSFIVPVDGVYMFLATTMNGPDFALNVDDTGVSRAVSYWAKHKHSDSAATVHAVLHLHAGQRVWVQHTNLVGYTFPFLFEFCSFSGFLLSRDFW